MSLVSKQRWLQPLSGVVSSTLFGVHRSPARVEMATSTSPKLIDSHLHVWASPQQAAEKYPYFPGQEPKLPGHVEFLLECMGDAGVDGALIVQPINHKFDHSYVTSVLKQYPSKFVGCCLANPAEDGTGIQELEDLISKDGYRAVRFNPYLWPSGQLMTNEVGKAMFAKAGDLGVPVGFMCMKGLDRHLSEIEELCREFPSTVVLLDHLAFCKPPQNYEEEQIFSKLLNLSRFPQGNDTIEGDAFLIWESDGRLKCEISKRFHHKKRKYLKKFKSDPFSSSHMTEHANYVAVTMLFKVYVKFSALFRVSRNPYPFEDLSNVLSKLVSSYGANRIMWGSDFPYVVPECGYKEAKEAACQLLQKAELSSSESELIMGTTVYLLLNCRGKISI